MRDDNVDENSLAFRQKELEIEQKKLEIIAKQREQRALDLDQAGSFESGSAGAALESANQSQQDSSDSAFNEDSGASAIEKVQAMREMTSA